MRAETPEYRAARQSYTTAPHIWVRAHFPRKAGDGTVYDFSRDFASHDVLSATVPKMLCLPPNGAISGNTQTIDPLALHSEIGLINVVLRSDANGEVLKYFADPARPLKTAVPATSTYVLRSTSSDLSGAPEFNLKLIVGTGTPANRNVSIASLAVEEGYGFTEPGDPGLSGSLGSRSYTVKVDIVTANANLTLRIFLARVNASGVVQSGPLEIGAETTLTTTGIKTFTGSVDLGTFAAGDRLRITYRWKNTVASTQACDIKVDGTSDALVPWAYLTYLEVDDARGYPAFGHVILDKGDPTLEEDFKYTSVDTTTTPHRLMLNGAGGGRARRGTSIHAHAVGTLVRNGEQLRRGVRLTVFAVYEEVTEAKALTYCHMEITQVRSEGRSWIVQAQDIQRFVKRTIFDAASSLNVRTLGPGHPITLLLRALTSTGAGTNGAYDSLSADDGSGVAQELIDIAGFETLRDAVVPGFTMDFREIEPQEAKEFMESQILRPFNCVPYVTQYGKLSGRRFGTPPFRGMAVNLPNVSVALS